MGGQAPKGTRGGARGTRDRVRGENRRKEDVKEGGCGLRAISREGLRGGWLGAKKGTRQVGMWPRWSRMEARETRGGRSTEDGEAGLVVE